LACNCGSCVCGRIRHRICCISTKYHDKPNDDEPATDATHGKRSTADGNVATDHDDNPEAMKQWMDSPQHVKQMTEMIDDPNIRLHMLGHMSENHEVMEQMREMMGGNMMGSQMMGNTTMNNP